MEVAALGLKVDGVSNIDQATTSLGRFTNSAESAESAASGLGAESSKAKKPISDLGNSSAETARGMSAMSSAAVKAGAVLGAAFSVVALKNYADAWSDMQSRVGAVTGDMAGAGDRMQRLVDIANASYAPLTQTAEVFSRNVATFRDLGRSADEAADFTEAVNNALVVTATRGEDAAVVVNSLSRSLAIGKLDADAFDTIVSRSPRTLKAVADQMGETTIELRKLATEGKVTSDVIATGLISSLEQLKSEAAEMPATMVDAFVRVGNNVTELVGRLDKASGASASLSSYIITLADGMRSITGDAESLASVVTALELAVTTLAAVASAKLIMSLAESSAAMYKNAIAAKAKAAADLESANAVNRAALAEQDMAKASLARARADVAAAEQQVASDRMVIASETERLKSTQAALAAEKALEIQRLQAQINDTGRGQSIARLAEIRLAEVAIIKQVEASERSLAATTLATSAAVQKAYGDRAKAAAASAAATATANQAAEAVNRTTTAVKAATAATGALAVVARGASAAMAFLGGPLGIVLIAASALTYFATRASEAEKESEALDARINKLAGSFDGLTVSQARSAIQDYGSKLEDATFAMETAEARAFTLKRNLEQFPNSKKAEEWARDLVTAEGAVDDARGAVDEINDSLGKLNAIVENGGAKKLGEDANAASDAFSKLNKQLSERLAIAGKTSDAERLAARIQGGFVEGLKDGEGDVLIALQKQIDAREALANAAKKASSGTKAKADDSAEKAAERFVENLKQQLFQTEKRTAVEKLSFDIQKDGLKLSEAQLAQATGIANAIDAAATAERDRSSEIDRQNTAYQLQESLIAKQQQYSGELSTAGMGPGAAGSMRERIAIEQQQQKELRDMQHQHGQELRAAESDAEREHLQEMFNERLALSRTFMAQELAAYDEFTAQKAELDGNWLLGMQEGFASYSEQALDLYGQTSELVKGVMDTLTEGIATSMTQAILYGEDLRTSMAAVGQTIMESVLNSLIQMGVQYGINSALEIAGITAVATAKNAAIATTAATSVAATSTTTATQVAAAATTTAAWTPAAIVSSIGSFGSAAAIGLAAVIAALAFSGGFKEGGYTGGGGVNDVAGVVHGKEYVFDAAATSRIGVPTLEAIRAGRPIPGESGAAAPSSGSATTQSPRGNVTVNQTNNFGSPDNRTANQVAGATARKQRMAQHRYS